MLIETLPEVPSSKIQVESINFREIKPALTLLIPTKNESGNIELLLSRISQAVGAIQTEVVFVDDSSDNTPEIIRETADRYCSIDIRLLHRQPEERLGGLGGAVLAGMRVARAPFVCVMDGDLQHPPELIPEMFALADGQPVDLVIASRRKSESNTSGLNTLRTVISRGLDLIARMIFLRELHGVSDPLTGFFLVRLDAIDLERFHPQGFKILLETIIRNPRLRKVELAFHFGSRNAGKSKASSREAYEYVSLLLSLRFGTRGLHFIEFAIVGASGILVNTFALAFATEVLKIYYLISVALATVISSTWNFFLTEGWVFSFGKVRSGRWKRFVLFFVMNNLALLVRGPIIYVLTSLAGMYYLISNLISLGIMTVLRYLLADTWIWSRKQSVQPLNRE
ncbi:MAG: glycosyltransferase [Chloroflexi bacterium]|nr:glycosyltransferase [Chloroflexota bacterium]